MNRSSLLTLLALTAAALNATTMTYHVDIDSSAANALAGGSGYIDLQFNQANTDALSAVATITNFKSTGFVFNNAANVYSDPVNVTGSFATPPLVIPNDAGAFNFFDQGVTTFGSSFGFDVTLSGPAVGNAALDGSGFFVSLLDFQGSPIVGTLGQGEVANILINPNGTLTPNSDASGSVVNTPEPSTALGGGLLLLSMLFRQKNRANLL